MKTSPRPSLVLAIVLCTAGLGCDQPLAPLPPPADLSADFIVASVAGQVIDADTGELVPDAVVTAAAYAGPGTRAVTDGSGTFRLEPRVRVNWESIALDVARDGYEPTQGDVHRNAPVVLMMYATLTLRPGESIQTRVHLSTYRCRVFVDEFDWIVPCRRVAIESAPDDPVEVELVPPTEPDNGLELQSDAYLETLVLKRRVTVTGGAVWIRGGTSPVTLTAGRP